MLKTTTIFTKLFALLLLVTCSNLLNAQSITIGVGRFSGISNGTDTFGPMRTTTTAGQWNRHAYIYPSVLFPTLAVGDVVGSLAFPVAAIDTNFVGTANLKIYLADTSAATFGVAALSWSAAIAGAVLVYDGSPASILKNTENWKVFNIANFTYSGGNLAVYCEYSQTSAQITPRYFLYDNNSATSVPQYVTDQVKYISATGAFTNSLTTSNLRHPQVRLDLLYPNNVGVAAITSPAAGYGLSATQTVTATITNVSAVPLTNVPVSLSVDGAAAINEVVPSIPADATVSYTFTATANLSTVGNHSVVVTTNQVGDNYPSNNTQTKSVFNSVTVASFPYVQNFEASDANFFVGGNTSFAYGTITDTVINAAASGTKAWKTNLSGDYSSNENGYVQSPKFNLTGVSAPELKFKAWYELESAYDLANVTYSINNGATWTLLGAKDTASWYNIASTQLAASAFPKQDCWSGDGSVATIPGSLGYKQMRYPLTVVAGQSSVIFRINAYSDGSANGSGLAFDDFTVQSAPNTITPFALVTPPNNFVLVAQGPPSTRINIRWNRATSSVGAPVLYTFLGDTLGTTNFSTPTLLVPANNNGLDTVLTLTLGAIDNLMAARGKNVGDTLKFSWSVRATDGSITTFATTPNVLSIVRGNLITTAKFVVDMRNQTVNANGVHIAGNKINNWNPAATLLTNGGVGTLFSTFVTLNARDTVEYKYLNGNAWGTDETVPMSCGVPNGSGGYNRRFIVPVADTVVVAVNCFSLCGACPDMSAFGLLTPTTGTLINAQGPPSTLINIKWRKSNSPTSAPVVYTWLADAPGGNFSNPVLSIPANNSGADTMLTFNYGAIDNLLAARNLRVGDTLKFIWTVRATDGAFTRLASTSNFLQIRRGFLQVAVTFKVNMSNEGLVSPNGVHIAGEMQGWNPATTMMTNEGAGVYKSVFTLNARDTIEYKYINGTTWPENEAVPATCAFAGSTNRFIIVPVQDALTVGPFCFSRCVDCVVGVKDQSFDAALSIYPNPANNNTVLSYNLNAATNLRIGLYNAMGELLYNRTETNALNGKLDIPVSNLSNGIYFVQVSNGTQYAVKQFVVQK